MTTDSSLSLAIVELAEILTAEIQVLRCYPYPRRAEEYKHGEVVCGLMYTGTGDMYTSGSSSHTLRLEIAATHKGGNENQRKGQRILSALGSWDHEWSLYRVLMDAERVKGTHLAGVIEAGDISSGAGIADGDVEGVDFWGMGMDIRIAVMVDPDVVIPGGNTE